MRKRNSKKGELLVETVVAMAVFTILTVSAFKAYQALSRINKKETEYIFFESVCLSIDSYYDTFGKDYWPREYFGDKCYFLPTAKYGLQRYDANYRLIGSNETNGHYVLTYTYDDDYNMSVTVENTDAGYMIIENLNYGHSLATSKNDIDYYSAISTDNVGIRQLEPKVEEEVSED